LSVNPIGGGSRLSRETWILTLLASAVVVSVGRVGPDWPAQEFRSWLARNAGLLAWNDAWYSGHALPGYSVLYPPIAAVFGAALTGLLAATACAWAGVRLASPVDRMSRRNAASVNVAIACVVIGNLILGQVPFLLGVAFGLLALLAHDRAQMTATGLLACASSLASPLAGLFMLMVGVALWRHRGARRSWPMVGASAGSIVAAVLGGSSGTFPFDPYSVFGIAAFVALGLVLIPRRLTGLRTFIGAYAVVAAVLVTFPNAVGGNVIRLAQLVGVPLALWVFGVDGHRLWRVRWIRPVLFLGSFIAALTWTLVPVVSAIARGADDPSSSPSYYAGLLRFLASQDPSMGRLEVPFTREHWEAAFVADHFPLARGWERQLDLQYNDVLYHPLTAVTYRHWLDATAVDLIALPTAPLDYGGVAERRLLAHPPAYLSVAYRDANWTVFRVAHATALVTGATLVDLGAAEFTVHFTRPATATIKVHASPLWAVDTNTACLQAEPDGWLHLRAAHAGSVTLKAQVTLATVLHQGGSACDDDH
jgi:hypothetical protein